MKNELDMTSGPLLKPLIFYAIPLILTGILQLLYSAADLVVVGQFAGSTALAAVGATGALSNLLINLLMGLAVGSSVLVAQFLGARDVKNTQQVVHTSILVALVGGFLFGAIGFALCTPLLRMMSTPENVLPLASLYMRIIFAGMPFNALYNFGAAILRSAGDTKHPLYFLVFSGLVNVGLNLLLVVVFHMDVAGVAIGTVASQAISAVLVLMCLEKRTDACHLYWRELKLHGDKFKAIIRIGVPAGIEGMMFSISNVLIQSSINSFGELAMAGNTAASNLDGFNWNMMNAVNLTATTFVGQNTGAGKKERINRTNWYCMGIVAVVGLVMGLVTYAFGPQLLRIYTNDAEVVRCGMVRLLFMGVTYFTCGWMDTQAGSLRGMGYSVFPTVVTVLAVCGLRIVWIYTYFAAHHTLEVLYFSYPLTWVVASVILVWGFFHFRKKLFAKFDRAPRPAETEGL